MSADGWSEEELSRMQLRGKGILSETDGRNFMALLDICHYLVDKISQKHNFADLHEASMLRSSDTAASALLTAQMYSYWDSAPAGPGVYEMLIDMTTAMPGTGAGSRRARETGQAHHSHHNHPGAALHALAVNECKAWPRRRKTGAFYFAGEDASGAALLADSDLVKIYRVLGISTSLGDMIRAGRGGGDLTGSSLQLTLLPFMGSIVYDGTVRGAPPMNEPSFLERLRALASSAQAVGAKMLVKELPKVVDTPLLRKRVQISGLQAKPELNGQFGVADSFDDASGRYCVLLEGGDGAYKLKPANLTEAPPRPLGEDASDAPLTLSENEIGLQQRIGKLRSQEDFWVFRRMGYTEQENPGHMGMIMSGSSGMVVGTFQSKKLAPTAAEYLASLERVLFSSNPSGIKPKNVAVDEKSAVPRLQAVLKPAGIQVGYYPPPTDEELTAMGASQH